MTASGRNGEETPDVLSPLKNKYSFRILCATRTPASARELSEAVDVPIATCYRRIEELVDAGYLEVRGRELSEGGRDEVTVDLTGPVPEVSQTDRDRPSTGEAG
jgi:predicted ArsR family transcriptional regulator